MYLQLLERQVYSVARLCPKKSFLSLCVIYTLSGRTGSALVWHSRGLVFESRLVHQVLRFVGSVNTVQYVELRGY